MEVTLLPKGGFKIRGKHASVAINPQDKAAIYNGAVLLENSALDIDKIKEECVMIEGPGEYEVAGIKISGHRNGSDCVYSVFVDGVDILIGRLSTLERAQHKLKEHNVLIVNTGAMGDASFVTSLATNAVLFYGEKAEDVVTSFAKDGVKKIDKYQLTADKPSPEMETILLTG